jgi:hypothetical protein
MSLEIFSLHGGTRCNTSGSSVQRDPVVSALHASLQLSEIGLVETGNFVKEGRNPSLEMPVLVSGNQGMFVIDEIPIPLVTNA